MRSIERGSAGPCVGSPVALIQSQRRYEAGLSSHLRFLCFFLLYWANWLLSLWPKAGMFNQGPDKTQI